ncbi:MAG: 5'/3'-nucleotidase SurE [Tannerella sp.]|jgi:5'-nucleotidase|nr:5'/3'-nucleotidase SurE [Tannerella sp.]
MSKEPLVLITNDDGVEAEGLGKLVESLTGLGELVVFAPDGPRSGMSSAITSTVPITCTLLRRENKLTVYSCTGTPVDCVKLAVSEILDRQPDLLVSGANHGGNQAVCVHYSGTMGAVIEGCIIGIPSLGVSLADWRPQSDFSEACRLGRTVAGQVLKHGLPRGTYLNLNVPCLPRVKGIAVCRQADGRWIREFCRTENPEGKPYWWLAGEFMSLNPADTDGDIQRLDEGYASLVPGRIDVTDHAFLETLKRWDLSIERTQAEG